ncbi:MAG: ATP-binding protein, partial [bacterium]
FRLVAEMLKEKSNLSFHITHMQKVSDARKALESASFDVILMDLDLPDSQGLNSLELIAHSNLKIPIIVLTGLDDEDVGTQAIQGHANDYLVKGQINSNSLSRSIRYSIERKKAESVIQRNLDRFELLSTTASELLQSTEPQQVVNSLCRKVMEHLDCHVFFNFLVDEKTGRLHLNAFDGISEEEAKRVEWLDYGAAVCGCVARDGRRIVSEHIPTTPDVKTDLVKSYGVKAYACHPILEPSGKVMGTLSFGTTSKETFRESDLALMKAVTDQVAIAIIRMHDEQKLQENQLEIARVQILRETQKELDRTKRLSDIGTLAATVAHELRNPLAAINITSAVIKRKTSDEAILKHLHNIEKSVSESDQIINNLLFYSKIKNPHLQNLDIYSVLEECISHTQERAKNKVSVKKAFDLLKATPLYGDPTQIKEVLNNILNNAFDAIPNGNGEVVVTSRDKGNFISIDIKDNGIGIPEGDIERIFDPFFTTKAKGTGLGLSVCKQIIKLHNGTVDINSVVGQGTTVSITLPKQVQ